MTDEHDATDPVRSPAARPADVPERHQRPRWVTALAVATAVVVGVVVVLMVIVGGDHGPGRHTGSAPSTPSSPPLPSLW